jgi:alpha-galactosidase
MPKIAIIGAGSIIFSTTLVNDILATQSLNNSEFVLIDPALKKVKKVEDYTKKIIDKNNLSAKVWSTSDRKKALKDADFVITTFQIGGMEAYKIDYEVPLKYGVDQCLGQCVGPGGIFRGLRSIPVLREIIQEMEELCPNALLMNYVNPMAINCIGICRALPWCSNNS